MCMSSCAGLITEPPWLIRDGLTMCLKVPSSTEATCINHEIKRFSGSVLTDHVNSFVRGPRRRLFFSPSSVDNIFWTRLAITNTSRLKKGFQLVRQNWIMKAVYRLSAANWDPLQSGLDVTQNLTDTSLIKSLLIPLENIALIIILSAKLQSPQIYGPRPAAPPLPSRVNLISHIHNLTYVSTRRRTHTYTQHTYRPIDTHIYIYTHISSENDLWRFRISGPGKPVFESRALKPPGALEFSFTWYLALCTWIF